MDIYLPIAGVSVNAFMIVALGGVVGLLTGMVGLGGGFLTSPICRCTPAEFSPSLGVDKERCALVGSAQGLTLASERRGL